MNRLRTVALLALLVGAYVATAADSRAETPPSEADRSALEAHEQLWAAASIADYTLTYREICLCPIFGAVTVEVAGGAIVSAADESGGAPPGGGRDVAALFAEIGAALDRPVDSIDVSYDATFGYPTRLSIDPMLLAIDDELLIEVIDFRADGFREASVQRLEPGWNLVGWRGDGRIDLATATIAGRFDAIHAWAGAEVGFLSYAPGLPPALNTLTEPEFGDGLWIRVTDPAGVSWSQRAFSGERSVALSAGLTLASWTGPDGAAVAEAVAGLGASLQALWTWDATTQSYQSYSPALPAAVNSASTLAYGAGVWVSLAEAAVWEQPAAEAPPEAPAGEAAALHVGERLSVPELGAEVRLDGVRDDSRCPLDVVCVWEGEVTVEITVTVGGVAERLALTVRGGGGTAETTALGVAIGVDAVLPEPVSTEVLTPSDYVVMVRVEVA